MLNYTLLITYLVLHFSACSIVAKKYGPEQASFSEEQATIQQETNRRVEHLQGSFSLLHTFSSSISSQIDTSIPNHLIEGPTPLTEENPAFSLTNEAPLRFKNVFSLCASLFRDLGLGRLEYSYTTGSYTQEFESLNAHRLTSGKAQVYLIFKGIRGNAHRTSSFSTSIRLVTATESKNFVLYQSKETTGEESRLKDGYEPITMVSLNELENFFDSFSHYIELRRNIRFSGHLETLVNEKENLRQTISSNLQWKTSTYRFIIDTLDIISRKDDSFKDASLKAALYNGHNFKIGSLNLEVLNLGEDNQNFNAQILYNKKNGI